MTDVQPLFNEMERLAREIERLQQQNKQCYGLGYREGWKNARSCVEQWATRVLMLDEEQVGILLERLQDFRENEW